MPAKMNATFYEALEVAPDASPEQIKNSYRVLTKKWHPDCHVGQTHKDAANKRMQAMNLAYETLKDPAKRRAYDNELRAKGILTRGRTPSPPPHAGKRASIEVRQAVLGLARSYFENLIAKHPNCSTAVQGAMRMEFNRRRAFVSHLVNGGHSEEQALWEWAYQMKRVADKMDPDTPRQ
jgi:curved DNA-binding protein CbpA